MIDEKKLIEYLEDLVEFERKKSQESAQIGAFDMATCYGHGEYCYKNAINAAEEQPKIGGWIPCSERLPGTSEYIEFEPTPYMKRIEIAYMTDTVEYLIGFYDGSKWMDKHHNIIKNVIAWKPFLKLPEAYHG